MSEPRGQDEMREKMAKIKPQTHYYGDGCMPAHEPEPFDTRCITDPDGYLADNPIIPEPVVCPWCQKPVEGKRGPLPRHLGDYVHTCGATFRLTDDGVTLVADGHPDYFKMPPPSSLRYVCCTHCIHPPLSTSGHDDPCQGCISECPHAEAEADVERAGRAGLWKVTLTCHGCEGKTTTVFATPQGWQA